MLLGLSLHKINSVFKLSNAEHFSADNDGRVFVVDCNNDHALQQRKTPKNSPKRDQQFNALTFLIRNQLNTLVNECNASSRKPAH